MCQFKSAIILKDRVFIPDYDSHSNMLKELGIADTKENAERLFIRAELIPVDNDVFSDISTWKFKVDQDILPDWYVEEYDKQRMIEAVKEWAKDRIHIGKENLDISDGEGHYIKDCTNVEIHGSAQVEKIYGSATVNKICGNAIVDSICGNATVDSIYGSATVITSRLLKWRNLNKAKLQDDATIKDRYAKTIYQAGGWQLKTVGESQG